MSAPDTDLALDLQGLQKTFRIGFLRRRVDAVRDATFTVRRGEVYGLVGPNGAGKTTTMKMLMGLISPDRGEARIFGVDTRDRRARAPVGFLPETPHFYEYLRPAEFLDYFGQLYGVSASDRARRIPRLIERVGLGHAQQKQLRKFSKGMLQRIGIAQALLPDPDLVVLDEPQSGLDPMGRKDVRDIIQELGARGKTVIFSSHILSDVERVCDRVAIMMQGRVIRTGTLDELVDRRSAEIEILFRDPQESAGRLSLPAQPARLPDGSWRLLLPPDTDLAPLLQHLIAEQVEVREVLRHRQDLEEIFVSEAARTAKEDPRDST